MGEPLPVRFFLSWSHRDQGLKENLMERLVPNLLILSGVRIVLWEDSDLRLGGEFKPEIAEELGRCDYGVLLLSEYYLTSPFILQHELPRFVGPEADKGALPVSLRPLERDGSRELHGIEQRQIFEYKGKAFSQLTRSYDQDALPAGWQSGSSTGSSATSRAGGGDRHRQEAWRPAGEGAGPASAGADAG